jgi:hypothetical protein
MLIIYTHFLYPSACSFDGRMHHILMHRTRMHHTLMHHTLMHHTLMHHTLMHHTLMHQVRPPLTRHALFYSASSTPPIALHSLYCTHCTALIALHSLYCTHCTALIALHSLHCTHCTALIVLHSLHYTHCTVCSASTILYTHTLYACTPVRPPPMDCARSNARPRAAGSSVPISAIGTAAARRTSSSAQGGTRRGCG